MREENDATKEVLEYLWDNYIQWVPLELVRSQLFNDDLGSQKPNKSSSLDMDQGVVRSLDCLIVEVRPYVSRGKADTELAHSDEHNENGQTRNSSMRKWGDSEDSEI